MDARRQRSKLSRNGSPPGLNVSLQTLTMEQKELHLISWETSNGVAESAAPVESEPRA